MLEQYVVFEDMTTFLSRVPARSGGTILPVSRLGDVSGLCDLQGLLSGCDGEF